MGVGSGWVHTSMSVNPDACQPPPGVLRGGVVPGPGALQTGGPHGLDEPGDVPVGPALGHQLAPRAEHRGQVGEEPVVVEHPVEGGGGQHGVDRGPAAQRAGARSRRSASTKQHPVAVGRPAGGGPRRPSTAPRRGPPPVRRAPAPAASRSPGPSRSRRRARWRRVPPPGGPGRSRPTGSWDRRSGRRCGRPSRRDRTGPGLGGRPVPRRPPSAARAEALFGHLGQPALAARCPSAAVGGRQRPSRGRPRPAAGAPGRSTPERGTGSAKSSDGRRRPRGRGRARRPRRGPCRPPPTSCPRRPRPGPGPPPSGRRRKRAEPSRVGSGRLQRRGPHVADELGRDLGQEAAGDGVAGRAPQGPAPGVGDVEMAPGPGDAHVGQPALLLQLAGDRPGTRRWGKTPSSIPTRKTAGNSRPLAVCRVMSDTRLPSSSISSASETRATDSRNSSSES